ncbi:MAG: tripartite tricarboxylate transporter substrate binding protein [Pseudomonadota bacterium]
MLVPFAPGGASDIPARIIQQKFSEVLGQQIVIENRDGANGIVGMTIVQRAKPDGYTIALANVGAMAINEHVYASMKLRPQQDFMAVSLVCDVPGVVVANPKFPANNLQELVAYVKKNPGKVSFAAPGAGSMNRLQTEEFALSQGLQMINVPYKGGANPVQDIMGGHVDFMFVALSTALTQVKSGRLKALGVATRNRVVQLPDLPTMVEQGFPNNVSSSWQGVFVPAGTPSDIINKLHAALVQTLKDPTVKTRMDDAGIIAVSSASPQAFQDFVAADSAKWGDVVRRAGIREE